jgi:uncharacterized membrane protein (TIGR02234 family)
VPGRAAVDVTGAQVSAGPSAVALLALAGVAAVVATGGVARRAVGLLLVLAGAGAAVVAARALWGSSYGAAAVSSALPGGVPADAPLRTIEGTAAPLITAAGAATVVVVGVFVLLREPSLRRLGARYGAAREQRADLDPDRAAWQDLDAGRDPTVDVAGDRGEDPAGGGRKRDTA